MPFSMRNQLDRYVVDPRVLGERSACQLRQLLIVAAWQARSYFPNVLLDYVGVVEEPVAGGADVETALSGVVQSNAYFLENFSRVIEAFEKRSRRSLLFCRRKQLVLSRNAARVLGETIVAEYLSADGSNESSVVGVLVAFQ